VRKHFELPKVETCWAHKLIGLSVYLAPSVPSVHNL